MSKGLIIFLIILAVVVAAVVIGLIVFKRAEKNLEKLSDIPVGDIDLSSVPDGTYEGRYKAFPVSVIVNVTVRGGKLDGIELVKHFNGQGGAAEVIPSKVVDAQTLQVDVVSGATYSSKVILLAIEDALKKAAAG